MTNEDAVYSKSAVDEMFLAVYEAQSIMLGMIMGQNLLDGTMTDEVAIYRLRQAAESASSPLAARPFLAMADTIERGLGPRFQVIDGGKSDPL